MRAREASQIRVVLVLAVLLALGLPALAAPASSCIPPCDVPSSEAGYVPAIVVVQSGSVVTWSGIPIEGTAHTATEGGGVSLAVACLHAAYSAVGSANATFTIHDGALWAQQPLKTERRCTSATASPDGSFVLQYYCIYHVNMKGVLVVRP